jgi:3-hydroxyisobutyrate dehydrogenase-like beta-hydroxyacid dehydrogenase
MARIANAASELGIIAPGIAARTSIKENASMKVGFIGLGQMGRGMAERLLGTGHALTVWNRTRAAALALEARGARVAARAGETLDADVVITMLADDAAVEAVWIAPALVQKMPASAIHLNMSTVSLRMGRRLAALHAECGTRYVSAPVFGRPEAAAAGQLDIIAAGPQQALARCAPLFEALGRRWFDAGGDAAQANVIKIARNFLLAAIIEGLGEAFALVQKSGVEPRTFLDIITSTSMNAPAYKNYGRLMIEPPETVTFTLKLGMKDVELALQAGGDTAVPLPMAGLIREQHLAAIAHGYGERDWAALGNYIAQSAGLGGAR